MNLSYWEHKSWFTNIDFTIVGSGIVGLNCAIQLKKAHPKATILVLEKGILPQGASTKNAGFACFGSISEIVSDLKTHTEQELVQLVRDRWNGIHELRNLLGDTAIGYRQLGGHELFLESDAESYAECKQEMTYINELLRPVFKGNAFVETENRFSFKGIQKNYISHVHEGQIDTGEMMKSLLQLALKMGITILNAATVTSHEDKGNKVLVQMEGFEFQTRKLFLATNGFATNVLPDCLRPARAQVIITKPIKNLHIQGTFHLEEGYYYFRNIDDRILLGGGRNLDFKTEETTAFGETSLVRNTLIELMETVILPKHRFEIENSWSGIMGVGPQKKPIVKRLTNNIACGVRLGGMGIAIGTTIGNQLASSFDNA